MFFNGEDGFKKVVGGERIWWRVLFKDLGKIGEGKRGSSELFFYVLNKNRVLG